MRLIWTVENEKQLLTFHYFLLTKGVESHIELIAKDDVSEPKGTLWIVDEDEVPLAKKWLNEYLKDPEHPQFQGAHLEGQAIQAAKHYAEQDAEAIVEKMEARIAESKKPSFGTFTFMIAVTCIALFTMFSLETMQIAQLEPGVTYRPYLYDYPLRQEIRDQRILKFGIPTPERVNKMPDEALELIQKEIRTPQWQGIYAHVSRFLQGKDQRQLWRQEPLFERIRQGQVWRVVTPMLLHGSLLHIFFNMIWLFVLGNQLERRLGTVRYLALIVITAALSNTAQYLMSGWSFLGYSGVVCGMLGFIWMRQKAAPWEGYQLAPGTIPFISLFIGGLALMQLSSFVWEILYATSFAPNIANTCHIAGGIVGILLAKLPFFYLQD